MEVRAIQNCELRAMAGHTLTGYASVFNQWSEDLGGFREQVKPGAFANSLRAGDVRALYNHDASKVLGRTTAGTLQLSEDSYGLRSVIRLPDNSLGNDLWESVRRGDVSAMSFGFTTVSDNWPSRDRRELTEVKLFDVSAVTYPAYPQTSISARSADGNKVMIGWYSGNGEALRTVEPTEDDRRRLTLMLRLAQMIR